MVHQYTLETRVRQPFSSGGGDAVGTVVSASSINGSRKLFFRRGLAPHHRGVGVVLWGGIGVSQGYNTLVRFGSADALGTLVALSLLRELGPVLAALLFASRSGSAMTAEIGLMKATEQLDAMAVMGVNPLARVVAPRFWAGLFSLPILTALFNVMGIIGGYYVGVVMIGLDEGSYWAQMQNAVDLHDDVINGLIKSLFFGVAVTLIAVFEGYDAEATAAGVSAATTRTVVTSALVILAMDFVLTAFMF